MLAGGMAIFLLVFLVALLAGTAFWFWALVDVLRRTDGQFLAAGQNKYLWAAVVFFGHLVGALIYLLVARPQMGPARPR